MVAKLRPKAYQKYLSLPLLGSVLDDFSVWSHQRGYSIVTVGCQLKHALRIEDFFREHNVKSLAGLTHSAFNTAWNYYRHRSPSIAGTVRQMELFLEKTHRLSPNLPRPKTPISSELDHFSEYLRKVRGLENSTIRSHNKYLKDFLGYIRYDANVNTLQMLTTKEIEGFLCLCAKRLNRYSLQHVVGYLRSFLRFQFERGVIKSVLHTMIDTPRIYRMEQLPRSLSWEMVNSLLLSIERKSKHGIRDYSMLFLIATYGMRACEVVSLTLDDIDWRAGVIRVPQRKRGNPLLLPLTDAVGDVLIEYLKKSRPELLYRELFLRIRAPNGPLKPTAVAEAFQLRVRKSGLNIPYQGPHCLRHSYAVHLLRRGTTVKAIGDLLGHRSAESTCVYLRLDIEDLRTVALPVPQGQEIKLNKITANLRPRIRDRKESTKSKTISLNPLRSFLAEKIRDYLQLKRSLGRNYSNEARTLHCLDDFLVAQYPIAKDLTAEIFKDWCTTLHYLSKTVRRNHMRHVRNFCLYRCRREQGSFIPDILTFPSKHQSITPYVFSESEIACLLSATRYLNPCSRCPLRSQTMRLAITLLYTTGLRHGELLHLKLGDFNSAEKTLLVKATKFHKSRIIPLSVSVSADLEEYLALRHKNRLPMEEKSPLVWNGYGGLQGGPYTATGFTSNWSALCSSLKIFTRKGRPPRIHDLRHSFALNALKRWYVDGCDVQAKLPLLSRYMGHVSIHSTHYYLRFVDGIRSEANDRFYENFGKVIANGILNHSQGGA